MKKLVLALALVSSMAPVWAVTCTVQTIYDKGRVVICNVCCDSRGNCTTICNR